MLQRKKELGSFLDCVFGRRTISLCKDGLRFRGDWYSSCTFSRIDYEHYLKLFELILMSKEECIKVIDYNEKGEIYTKCKSVLEGLNRYFARFGVVYSVEDTEKKDTESTDKKSKAEQICCTWMYHALKKYILEALLISNLDGKLIDKEEELIDEQLIKAMKAVSPSPFGQVPVSIDMTQKRTIRLYSRNYLESECNYFTSLAGSNIALSHITNYYKRITNWIECPILYGEEDSACEEVLFDYFSSFSEKRMYI